MRIALALAAVAVCVSVAGVLAARQEAGQRLDDRAASAHSIFQQRAAARARHVHGRAARAKALTAAAAEAGRATGTQVSLGAPAGPGRVYTYTLGDGGQLKVAVPSNAVASATLSALFMGLGIGAGVVLVLVSLLVAGIDRAVAAPLARFAEAIKRAQVGDSSARADENAPLEIRDAARSFNSFLAKVNEQRERLKAAAASDPLTGVTNNQQFHESLGIELKRAQRESTAVSLVVLDLDGFGSINDAHGRSFGDELLQRVADHLRAMMRATDLLARIGGDDFALILPGADGKLAATIAERARKAVGEASTSERRIACSAGVASYPEDARDGATLFQLACGALRWAKSSGRGQTRRYDPENVSVPTDQEERAEIEGLLEREQPVIPFFQPLVSLSTGRILGFEALSRFPEPPGRGPDAWFAQAARVGLGPRLEAAALRAALAKEGRPPGTFLSINVSPTTLGSAEVKAVLPEDMTGLVVEITEHELADDLDTLEKELASLRERGAKIAVDDAGAGYSGLQQVMRIQPDVIKLDRSLVMNLHEDPAKEALIDSFVRFARRTGASVCAEGIETMDELKLLADLDVTYGQGYVLARPAPEWGTVANSVSETLLRSSLRSQGDSGGRDEIPESGDQRLEYVSAKLSKIHSFDELVDVFGLIGAELGADEVCLSRWMREDNAIQTVVDTESSEPAARFNLSNYPSTAHVLNTGEAMQVLVSDPGADLGELALLGRMGFGSLLMVPVVCRDERLGLLEAYSTVERPWTRSEINRARIISYQLGAVLDGLERERTEELLARQ
ncbi:MAG TPA: EAL domain-containing protein [Thermoleophilaceae bacterium]|nr:EAL domain-containing protein [Thermoleophilaceae bacterium]